MPSYKVTKLSIRRAMRFIDSDSRILELSESELKRTTTIFRQREEERIDLDERSLLISEIVPFPFTLYSRITSVYSLT